MGLLFFFLFDRLVVDEWLELTFPSSETGQEVLSAVQTLRTMWSHLLEIKLRASESKNLQCSGYSCTIVVFCRDGQIQKIQKGGGGGGIEFSNFIFI